MIFWMRTNIRAVSSATVFYTLLVFLTQIADWKHIAFGRRIFDSCKTKSNYLVHFKLVLKLIWNTTIIGTIEKLFNLQSNWYNFVLFIHNIKTTVLQCLFMTTNFWWIIQLIYMYAWVLYTSVFYTTMSYNMNLHDVLI